MYRRKRRYDDMTSSVVSSYFIVSLFRLRRGGEFPLVRHATDSADGFTCMCLPTLLSLRVTARLLRVIILQLPPKAPLDWDLLYSLEQPSNPNGFRPFKRLTVNCRLT